MGRVGHLRAYHLDEMPEYENSSPEDLHSDPETLPTVQLGTPSLLEPERPNFTGEIQERSGMGGRVAWEDYDEQMFFGYGFLECRPVDP